jgi:hypothetical protein
MLVACTLVHSCASRTHAVRAPAASARAEPRAKVLSATIVRRSATDETVVSAVLDHRTRHLEVEQKDDIEGLWIVVKNP